MAFMVNKKDHTTINKIENKIQLGLWHSADKKVTPMGKFFREGKLWNNLLRHQPTLKTEYNWACGAVGSAGDS